MTTICAACSTRDGGWTCCDKALPTLIIPNYRRTPDPVPVGDLLPSGPFTTRDNGYVLDEFPGIVLLPCPEEGDTR